VKRITRAATNGEVQVRALGGSLTEVSRIRFAGPVC